MIKVDVFSGFLGAGKTTLIKKLIREAYAGEKLVLIENEFGEIGIDGGFMQDAGIQVTEMNSGCICCSLTGDFRAALRKVAETYAPDRILIEPSGVGKLSDVVAAVEQVEDSDLAINALGTVVDAGKCKIYMRNFGEFFNNQVENAGCIVLSRTGNLSPEKIAECVALLREKNAQAVIITTPWEELEGSRILSALERRDTLEAALAGIEAEHGHGHHAHDGEHGSGCGHHPGEEDGGHEHHHDHESGYGEDGSSIGRHDGHEGHDDHHHHHHHHGHNADEVFTAWGLETARKFSEGEIRAILEKLGEEEAYGQVLRSKGIVDASDGCWIHFDYTPGEIDIRRGSAGVTGRLCVIGSRLKEEALAALLR